MNKQDIAMVRTAQDLERKYNFSNMQEETIRTRTEIQSLNTDLKDFSDAVTGDIENLQNQIDGNVTSWFESGVPTLDNFPANEWATEELKKAHLGDLYYDRDTGYAYRFSLDNGEYSWVKLADNAVSEALAIANQAQDTADSKRRVFVTQPTPPYDNGDLWINDKEIWVCQIAKQTGTYEVGDFINELKYTDDTRAEEVNNELTITKGTVTTISDSVDELKSTMNETVTAVSNNGEAIGTLEQNQSTISQTVNDINLEVSKKVNKGGSAADINSTAGVKINANKVSLYGKNIDLTSDNMTINSNNFTVDKYGNMECSNAKITGGEIVMEDSDNYPAIRLLDPLSTTTFSKIGSNNIYYQAGDKSLNASSIGIILNKDSNTFLRIAPDGNISYSGDSLKLSGNDNVNITNKLVTPLTYSDELCSHIIHENGSNGSINLITPNSQGALGGTNGIWLSAGGNVTLNPAGGAYVRVGNGGSYLISTTGGNLSSKNLKKNIKEFNNKEYQEAIDLLKNIKIYDYDYRYKIDNPKDNFGFIIDEVEELPNSEKFFRFTPTKAVVKDGYLDEEAATRDSKDTISYKRYDEEMLVKYLLTICKAQQDEIDNLKNRVEKLEGEIK